MKRSSLLIPLLALATLTHAQQEAHAQEKDGGFYLGAGVGQFNVQADDIDDIGPIIEEFDADDTSFKVFGGWQFGKFVAVELDYIDFGGPEDDVEGINVETDLNGFAGYVIGTLPLGPVELFAKVGYLFYDLEVAIESFEESETSDEDLVYGLGAGITLFDSLHTRIEYEMIDVSETLDDADALWLSAAWRF